MNGYAGRMLYVDLTTGKTHTENLSPQFAREYIGGLGFAAKMYLDLIKDNPRFDALAPENPFIVMTGPLTGLRMNGVARWTVCSKSPQTGLWGTANAGGFFGAQLKFAGYDGIVITGAAERPVYLHIQDQRVEIRDAAAYWGQDVYTVNDRMIEDLKTETGKKSQVLAIGPAGENLVRFASLINNKGHAAGRTGMGAVWGSKKLKAITVSGSGKLAIAFPEKINALRDELDAIYDENTNITGIKAAGTCAAMDVSVLLGDIPMKNWRQTEWERFDEIGPSAYADKLLVGTKTCYGCGIACKRVAEVKEGTFAFAKGPGPEYETVAAFGPLCLNADIESIGKANDICNRYGMDTISCGASIAFAIDCFENGLIDESNTGGLTLTWGNAAAIVALAEQIGRREGFGKILSEGSEAAARHIGKNAVDFLSTVKGLEAPMHDPRSAHGLGLAYAVSPRGACHMASLQYNIESGQTLFPEFSELEEELVEMSSIGKARLNVIAQDFGMFFSHCAIFCNLGASILTATQAIDMVNHVTGFDWTLEELVKTGRRLWYLNRGISNLFGATENSDRLPSRLAQALESGPTEGSTPDMELMRSELYALLSLDENGIPEPAVLDAYNLETLKNLLAVIRMKV